MTTDKRKDGLTYCGELVRRHDPDRFLISLMLPPESRPALWALFAFNHEIAKTREIVTETTMGLIRLQWWRDAIKKIYEEDSALENEVLPELHTAIKAYDLPRELFDSLVYAREFDLENVAPETLDGLEKYADFTNTPLLKLALQVLRQEEEEGTVQRVATGYGITGILRAVPFHKAQGRSYMPGDLSAQNEDVYVTQKVAAHAHVSLQSLKPNTKLLKASKAISEIYLKQIKSLRYDLYDSRMALPPPFFHLRVLRGSL